MERHGVTAEHAFDRLLRASPHTNIKLADVAAWLTTDRTSREASPPRTSAGPDAS